MGVNYMLNLQESHLNIPLCKPIEIGVAVGQCKTHVSPMYYLKW